MTRRIPQAWRQPLAVAGRVVEPRHVEVAGVGAVAAVHGEARQGEDAEVRALEHGPAVLAARRGLGGLIQAAQLQRLRVHHAPVPRDLDDHHRMFGGDLVDVAAISRWESMDAMNEALKTPEYDESLRELRQLFEETQIVRHFEIAD